MLENVQTATRNQKTQVKVAKLAVAKSECLDIRPYVCM